MWRRARGGGEEMVWGNFSTVALTFNIVQKDVWAVSIIKKKGSESARLSPSYYF